MKKILTAALVCLSSLSAMAIESGHAVDIKTDKIIINTDSLGLPKSTTAYEVLTLLPDLVERSKDFLFDNYTIQINGKAVGSARDAVLNQIRISDLRCIEVCENSLSALSAQGEGGSISLELRDATKGFSGAVNADVTTEACYSGGLRMDDQKGKWTFRSIATIENYVPANFAASLDQTNTIDSNPISTGLSESIKQRDFSEYVSTFIDFKPSNSDLLKFHVSEVYTNSREWHDFTNLYDHATSSTGVNSSRTKNLDLFAAINYEHSFNTGGKLCMELNYRYIPEKNDGHYYELVDENTKADIGYKAAKQEQSYDHKAHNVYGELKLEQPLMQSTATTSAKMELGAQYSYSTADNDAEALKIIIDKEQSAKSNGVTLSTIEDTYFMRPYFKIEARYNKWQFMGNIDYQHFSYQTKLDGGQSNLSDISTANHKKEDFTGQLVAMFTPNKHNILRLRYIRSINRPDAKQLFPYQYVNPTFDINENLIGNPDLKPSKQDAFDLDYAFDLSTNTYNLEIKASVEYSHTFDGIHAHSSTEAGLLSYYNIQKMDVIMGDLGMYFRKGIFSAWLSGNIYHNYERLEEREGYSNHYTYYNILLRPVLNFQHGWIIAANLTYNSPVNEDFTRKSSIFYGGLRIGKSWKHFSAYIYGLQNFSGKVQTTPTTNISYVQNEEWIHSYISAGVRYRF